MTSRKIKVCFNCKEKFPENELTAYASPRANILHNYCTHCLKEKQNRDNFSEQICSIFGIKTPGPRIWTERKRLIETYGYTDEIIINCLNYLYKIKQTKILSESLCLINPLLVEQVKQYMQKEKITSWNFINAINTDIIEHIAPIQENKKILKKQIDPDEWLIEDDLNDII